MPTVNKNPLTMAIAGQKAKPAFPPPKGLPVKKSKVQSKLGELKDPIYK